MLYLTQRHSVSSYTVLQQHGNHGGKSLELFVCVTNILISAHKQLYWYLYF